MNTNSNETDNSSNVDVDEDIVITDDMSDDDKADAYKRIQDQNRQLFARTKKAEGFVPQKNDEGKTVWVKKTEAKKPENTQANTSQDTTAKPSDTLSTNDLYTLMNAKVPEEDVAEVQEYAKLKNISIKEALNSTVVKTILSEKAEMRNTSQATNTGDTKRQTGKVSGDAILEKAQGGTLPESDEDMEALVKARKGIK